MKKDIKVTIIMPVYNAQKYINLAVESILKQTYRNYELIIIDDGAKDGTGEICKEYSKQYKNIKYIKQENAGTCAARNRGIELASGDYIAFSDHDDEYYPEYLEELVKYALETDSDVVKCGVEFKETYNNGKILDREEKFKRETISQKKLIERYNSLPICFFAVWNTLFKTRILKNNNVRFPVTMRHGEEDFYFNTAIIPFIKKIGFIDKSLYIHYRRTMQSTSAKFYADRIDAIIANYHNEIEVLKALIAPSEWQCEESILFARKISGIISYCINNVSDYSDRECKHALDKFLKECKFKPNLMSTIYGIKRIGIKNGAITILALFRMYTILIKLWEHKNGGR